MIQWIKSLFGSLVVTLWLAGCARSSPVDQVPGPATVRDSAGVQIVSNAIDESSSRCSIAAEPDVRVGDDDTDAELLDILRHADAFPGGSFVLLVGETEIRFYSPDGALTATYHQTGHGPGELIRGVDVFTVGEDSVAVADDRVRELLVLDDDARFIRSVPLHALTATPETSAVLHGGVSVHVVPRRIESTVGFSKRYVDVFVYDSSGRLRDSLGVRHYGYRGFVEGDVPLILGGWFDGETHLAALGQEVAVGSGTEAAVQIYRWNSDEAALQAIVRWTPVARSVGDEHIATYMADWQSRSPDPGSAFAVAIRDALLHRERPIPNTFPEHHQLLYGHDGTLWVQQFTAPGDEIETWLAFDGSGIFECALTLPDFREVAAFGQDFVLVLEDLEGGLQTAARYALHREY